MSAFSSRRYQDRRPPVTLGNEPALNIDGSNTGTITATPINLRWLGGTLLMGLTGLALIGGSVFTAMQGEARLAIPPEGLHLRTGNSTKMTLGGSNNARKTDRIIQADAASDIRQTLRISSVSHTGDREVVRTRPVVRISASLNLVKDENLSIPPFNPGSIFSDADEKPAPEAAPEEAINENEATPDANGDISYVTQELSGLTSSLQNSPEIPLGMVLQKVKEMATLESVMSGTPQNGLTAANTLDMAAPMTAPQDDSFDFRPRRPMPNMSVMGKTTQTAQPNIGIEKAVNVQRNENIEEILEGLDVPVDDRRIISAALGAGSGYGTLGLQKGQTVNVLLPSDTAAPQRPMRVVVRSGPEILARIALNDLQRYVAIDSDEALEESSTGIQQANRQEAPAGRASASIYESIYTTADQQDVPRNVTAELIRIFGHSEDLQRRASASDTLDMLYATREDGSPEGKPEIIYAALTAGDRTQRYYFFKSAENPAGDYFDETGRSARKFLVNKPVAQGILRSGFGSRRHPILGYSRAHTGIDWSAPRGTPIFAAGDGAISVAGWQGGYGRAIRIEHANSHETVYAHMSNFAPGIKEGMRVKQGQTIGYVGSTGLSTGPHLHFEIRINGRPQDPMRLRVPKQEELSGEALAKFRREKEKLDTMMGRSLNAERNAAEERKG